MNRLDKPVALFIPCYVDQFYPQVGIATLELLEKLGCKVEYPLNQTCCGQPFANSGYKNSAGSIHRHFTKTFSDYSYVVCPSGSCTQYVREHLGTSVKGGEAVGHNTFELIEFLYDVLEVREFDVSFPKKVGLHQSCHGLRGLRLAKSSELNLPDYNKTRALLETVKDITLMPLDYPDECCGFGGTFSVMEEGVSVKMGVDRINDHKKQGVDVIAGNDMSCLMHLEGLLRREKTPIQVCHVAEILNGKV